MNSASYTIHIPRNQLRRSLLRAIGKMLLPVLARVKILGKENFPKEGPVILVGNHSAIMEPVLMAVFSPQPIEILGSVDVPHEVSTQAAFDFYQVIPVFRGKPERHSLNQALGVLEQRGFLALFPEGGLWNPGQMIPKSGVSFLSHRGKAPVLPIAFVGMEGAFSAIFKLKRPKIEMRIGELIPALELDDDADRKQAYEAFAQKVMGSVFELLPVDELAKLTDVIDEHFSLKVKVMNDWQEEVIVSADLGITEQAALAQFLHRPVILKIFNVNLKLPIESLQTLHMTPPASAISQAARLVISYLKDEQNGNPFLLTYRFGMDTGTAMLHGLEELVRLCDWAESQRYSIIIQPTRVFYSRSQQRTITQHIQAEFHHWR